LAAPTESIRYVKGIGEQRAKALEKLGIKDLFSLISYFPRTYEDRRTVSEIGSLRLGESACVKAIVSDAPRVAHIRRGLDIVKLRVFDRSGSLSLTFFNQSYVRDQLKTGEEYWFFGRVGGTLLHPEMTNPVFERENAPNRVTGRIVPVYRLTAGITQNLLMRSIAAGLAACSENLSDPLPFAVREKHALPFARYAYEKIHFPSSLEDLEPARRRFVFEELFILTCALGMFRERRVKTGGIKTKETDLAPFSSSLPYALTSAQLRSINEAVSDMTSGRVMNRLLQGDVGSGKTAVAAACAWHVFRSGLQTAFMAPTEILAEQHFSTLSKMLAPLGMKVDILTGHSGAKQRREVLSRLKSGETDIVVGTHALLSDAVSFNSLALVITDEQHRFGVAQRAALSQKGETPHVLVMSATPIPRTLALIIYGDLDVSLIDELPPGRKEVRTVSVGEDKRERLMGFVRKQVAEGRQVFIVCPLVEEGEESPPGLKAAGEYAEHLQKNVFPDLRIALIHGKMKPAQKEKVMAAFAAGEADILVATTIIEVGIDVPNASLIIVENAERFGLSQLHQLRGRVGRGQHESFCVLVSSAEDEGARARLNAMCRIQSGFKIAEEDLRLRGPGDFFGNRQHGLPDMKIADLSCDMGLLREAQSAALELLACDPHLEAPENRLLRERINKTFSENADSFN